MDVSDAIITRRSIRRFQKRPVPVGLLKELLELARYYPCAANLQPLRFAAVNEHSACGRLFSCLRWAGYLQDYQISEDERPAAYIVIFEKLPVGAYSEFAAGAVTAELLLAIHEKGFAGCCLGVADPQQIADLCGVDRRCYEPKCIIAVGYPGQDSTVTDEETGCQYYLNECGDFVVPKRTAKENTLREIYQ